MTPASKLYRRLYSMLHWFFRLLFPIKITGVENIPPGAVMACANHTNLLDAFFIAIAFGKDNHLHIIAKKELFRIPVVSSILKKLEMIGVDREISDISAIRAMLGFLKQGEKIAIFPEGTRVSVDDAVAAKRGAVWMAERAGVPLLPVYITVKKRLFRKNLIVIGNAYDIPKTAEKRAAEDYLKLADELMESIQALGADDVFLAERQKKRAGIAAP